MPFMPLRRMSLRRTPMVGMPIVRTLFVAFVLAAPQQGRAANIFDWLFGPRVPTPTVPAAGPVVPMYGAVPVQAGTQTMMAVPAGAPAYGYVPTQTYAPTQTYLPVQAAASPVAAAVPAAGAATSASPYAAYYAPYPSQVGSYSTTASPAPSTSWNQGVSPYAGSNSYAGWMAQQAGGAAQVGYSASAYGPSYVPSQQPVQQAFYAPPANASAPVAAAPLAAAPYAASPYASPASCTGVPNACYAPVVAQPAAPVIFNRPCTQQTFQQQVVNYMPQTRYRTVYQKIPVTNYRPVFTTDPTSGCPVTTMMPCVTYAYQPARVPVYGLRPILSTVPAGPCSPCGGTPSVAPPAQPYYGAPAATIPTIPSVPGAVTVPGATTIPGATTVPAQPGYAVPGAGVYPGIQPADVRPSLVPGFSPGYGPGPDTGVGSRVNYPPESGLESGGVVQPEGATVQPGGSTDGVDPSSGEAGANYSPESGPTLAKPQSSVRIRRDDLQSPTGYETPPNASAHPSSTTLRPIPRMERESPSRAREADSPAVDRSHPSDTPLQAPPLLDPLDRTARKNPIRPPFAAISYRENEDESAQVERERFGVNVTANGRSDAGAPHAGSSSSDVRRFAAERRTRTVAPDATAPATSAEVPDANELQLVAPGQSTTSRSGRRLSTSEPVWDESGWRSTQP